MKCFLHIGSHKTGTSALQERLFGMSEGENSQIVYPRSCLWPYDRSHNMLAIHLWDDVRAELKTNLEGVLAALEAELITSRDLVISSEMLEKVPLRGNTASLDIFLSRLTYWGFETHVIYVLRRQDVIIDSIFKQWVANYDTRFCGDPLQMAQDEIPQLFYSEFATSWRKHPQIASVTLIPYVETRLSETAEIFLQTVNLPWELNAPLSFNQTNTSLDGRFLCLKHVINNHNFTRSFNDFYVQTLINSDLHRSEPRISIMSEQQRIMYLNNFAEDNCRLAANFKLNISAWGASKSRNSQVFSPLSKFEIIRAIEAIETVSPELSNDLSNMLAGR
jgi:hypothetical protein